MYCTNCGAQNDEGQRFCTNCGHELDKEPEANQKGARKRTFLLGSAIALIVVAVAALLLIIVPVGLSRNTKGSDSGARTSAALGGGSFGDKSAGESSDAVASGVADAARGQASAGDLQAASDHAGRSSVVGNLINGGHVASGEDGMLYYASPVDGTDWDTRSIVRCSPDGTGKTTIYTAPNNVINVYHITVIQNNVVFSQVIENASTIMRVKTDGSGVTTLDSCDDWSLCEVYEGWVYYLKSGRIHRCDLDGGNRTALADMGNKINWRVWDDNMYSYAKDGAREVYVSSLDGSNRSALYSAPDGYEVRNMFPLDSNRLLVWLGRQSGGGTQLGIVDLGTKECHQFWTSSNDIERVCSYPDGAIVTQKEPTGTYTVSSIPYSTGSTDFKFTAASSGQARYTSYVLGSACYGVVSDNGQCSVHAQPLGGGNNMLIAD